MFWCLLRIETSGDKTIKQIFAGDYRLHTFHWSSVKLGKVFCCSAWSKAEHWSRFTHHPSINHNPHLTTLNPIPQEGGNQSLNQPFCPQAFHYVCATGVGVVLNLEKFCRLNLKILSSCFLGSMLPKYMAMSVTYVRFVSFCVSNKNLGHF